MFRGYQRQPASNDSSHLGQCVGNCGRSRCDRRTRAYRPILWSSATSACELGHIDRYYGLQRPRFVTNAPLQSLRGGLPHAAFRGDYMTQLRALLPTPPSMNGEPASSPESVRGTTPRSKRRAHRPFRPVRVMSAAVGALPVLTIVVCLFREI